MAPKLCNCISYNLYRYGLVQDAAHWILKSTQIPRQFEATIQQTRTPYSAGAKTKEHLLRGVVNQDGFIEDQRNTT